MSWGCTISPTDPDWDYNLSHRAVWGLFIGPNNLYWDATIRSHEDFWDCICQSHRGVYHCSVGLSRQGDCMTLLAGTVGCETRTSMGLCVWVATTDRIEMVRQLC